MSDAAENLSGLVSVDARRVLPSVPTMYRFPLAEVHGHAAVRGAGGMSNILEGVLELPFLRRIVQLDGDPKNIPPPVRGLMRSVYRERPIGLVIIAEGKCWWIDVHG
jgi:hypothetical protein